jgi:hypothetical protein
MNSFYIKYDQYIVLHSLNDFIKPREEIAFRMHYENLRYTFQHSHIIHLNHEQHYSNIHFQIKL